jgi:hypothetical protein
LAFISSRLPSIIDKRSNRLLTAEISLFFDQERS